MFLNSSRIQVDVSGLGRVAYGHASVWLLVPLGYCSITDCVHEAVGDSGH